jgi:S-formylglutathione hydrolase FrmB
MTLGTTSRVWLRPGAALLVATGIATAATAAPPADVAKGAVLRVQMTAPSVGETERTVRIYLPPSYSRPGAAQRRYPVVYMLHGWPGSDGNMLEMGHANDTADSLIARGAIPEIIMVFPNGRGAGLLGRSYWINSFDGKKRVADYVTRDLIEWVDGNYRTHAAAAGRGIIGLSEGGDAAVNLALRHPDLFSACGGHSADYVLEKGLGTAAFLGSEPKATEILRENSPMLYVDRIGSQVRKQHIYIDCGTEDESIHHNREFHARLDSLGVQHEYHEFPGSHTWNYWSRHFRESLLAVAGVLN